MTPLPLELLYRRLNTEFDLLAKYSKAVIQKPELRVNRMVFPLESRVELDGIVSFLTRDGAILSSPENSFMLTIRRDYPFMKPGIRWLTDIFHPNIAPPSDGGVVCTRLLQEWRADRTLLSLVEGIANLVEHPNMAEPLHFDSCMRARDFFAAKGTGP